MLTGVRTAVDTIFVATPYLGGAVALIVMSSPMLRRQSLTSLAIGGATTGALIGTGWELTYNANVHDAGLKVEVITGTTAIGAGSAVLAGAFMG